MYLKPAKEVFLSSCYCRLKKSEDSTSAQAIRKPADIHISAPSFIILSKHNIY